MELGQCQLMTMTLQRNRLRLNTGLKNLPKNAGLSCIREAELHLDNMKYSSVLLWLSLMSLLTLWSWSWMGLGYECEFMSGNQLLDWWLLLNQSTLYISTSQIVLISIERKWKSKSVFWIKSLNIKKPKTNPFFFLLQTTAYESEGDKVKNFIHVTFTDVIFFNPYEIITWD